MENEIIVKNYADLVPFFEEKILSNQIRINNLFITEVDNISYQNLTVSNIKDAAIQASDVVNYVNQAKSGKEQLEAIFTPKMRQALENGTARLCKSHKDGEIFSKIQYNDGSSEFISLKNVKGAPNYANMAVLANQMQMQQTIKAIQDVLMDFAEETDRQLTCLQRDNHDNRMLKAETAKLDFETFLESPDYIHQLKHSLNEAFPAVKKELERNLSDLQDIFEQLENKKTSFGMKKMIQKEQILIDSILEDSSYLQVLCNIEMYLYYKQEDTNLNRINHSMFDVQKKYSEVLINSFSPKRLELLSGLSTLPEDIWRNNFMPGIKCLKTDIKEVLLCQNNVQENIMEVV